MCYTLHLQPAHNYEYHQRTKDQKMKKKYSSVAHALVGWYIPGYAENALTSMVSNRLPGQHLFVYLTGGWENTSPSKSFLDQLNKKHITYKKLPHNTNCSTKTGSLYEAYNEIFTICHYNDIAYLNLMQTDFQLMWWDTEIEEEYIYSIGSIKNAVQLLTGFMRKGSHPDIASSGRVKRMTITQIPINYESHGGIGDWGFFDITRFFNYNLSWQNSETFMSRRAHELGLILPISNVPTQAPIPWPVTVRDLKKGYKVNAAVLREPILVAEPFALEYLKKQKAVIAWQEDWLKASHWILEPIWATDLTLEYFTIQLRNNHCLHDFPFRWTKAGEIPRNLPPIFAMHAPRLRIILLVLVKSLIRDLFTRFKIPIHHIWRQ